jgi:hypothetical protein
LSAADGERQLSLLEPPDGGLETERDRTLARVIDDVRGKFGPRSLGRGGALDVSS